MRKVVRRLLAWIQDYLQHRRARVTVQDCESSYSEFEKETPQCGIPSRFNLLMEQLVALPFREGTILLRYADGFPLVMSGRGSHLTRTQQELDLINDKYEKLGLKI